MGEWQQVLVSADRPTQNSGEHDLATQPGCSVNDHANLASLFFCVVMYNEQLLHLC